MVTPMPRPRPPHLHRQVTQHGKAVWYVRLGKGPRIRIRSAPGENGFEEAYQAALQGERPTRRGAAAGTLEWLVARYRETTAWSKLSVATRRQRENIFKNILAVSGAQPFDSITRKVIVAARDKRSDAPSMARHMLETMHGLFAWAVDAEHVKTDPTRDIKAPKKNTDGHHTWTDQEVAKYEARWPIGTRERLAFDVLLYTGLRRGDAVRLGVQHIKDGVATIRTEKTGQEVSIPILPPLALSIAKSQRSDLALICGSEGEPLTKESFGNYFRDWCVMADVPGRAHGLRKAGATRAANNGATVAQLEAIFGWRGGGMASLYTRKADRKHLAKEAIGKLMPNAYSLTSSEGEGLKSKNRGKTDG